MKFCNVFLLVLVLSGCVKKPVETDSGSTQSDVPSLNYASSTGLSGKIGAQMTVAPSAIAANGSEITGCKIKDGTTALPNTLAINYTNCIISGIPTSVLPSTTYTIVATNSMGDSADATVSLNVPAITLNPATGAVGALVNITGVDISSLTSVTIGGTPALIVNNSSDSISVLVMPGTVSGAATFTYSSGSYDSVVPFSLTSTGVPLTQQGPKIIGTGGIGASFQGYSVSVSADGNTALVGAAKDNSFIGASWVYTRTNGVWSQQGVKLVGTGAVGNAQQGTKVALSADGNTALVAGPYDNSSAGAVWFFTRTNGVWSQQGSKIVGTGATGSATVEQGTSVALSADGNTALVGGMGDNNNVGAVWVFNRVAGVWSQSGSKLIGTGSVGTSRQGWSVAISSDGSTALIGGSSDNSNIGATWVFIRSGSVWSQQGSKLVGTGGIGTNRQGFSVSLSADGNTAIIGGTYDNTYKGASWIFSRTSNTWSQQGSKLVGTGGLDSVQQGFSVSLSADGNTALIGAPGDNNFAGASWVFTRSSGVWTQQGSKLVGTGAVANTSFGYSVCLSSDGNTAFAGGLGDNSNIGAAWVFIP